MPVKLNKTPVQYVVFLRGINVGGHHKVPMAELCNELSKLGFLKVISILNSGNVLFHAVTTPSGKLDSTIAKHLEKIFGFPIPVLLRKAQDISNLIQMDPFAHITVTKQTRLYVSFLKEIPASIPVLPLVSQDRSYTMLEVKENAVFSVLDLSINGSPEAMHILEQIFGKNITTRNWNTLLRIQNKMHKI